MQHKLTPQMRQLLERIAKAPNPSIDISSAENAKASYAKTHGVLDVAKPELKYIENIKIPARDNYEIPARLTTDNINKDTGILLFTHGGGFTIGSIDSHDIFCQTIAKLSGHAVLSIDYRLAPEWRFPTAVNDAWDSLSWLHTKGCKYLNLNKNKIAVGGDSAGGTLAAVNAIHARDLGLELALQLLIYPGTTDYQNTPSHDLYSSGQIITKDIIDWFFHQYIDSIDRCDWRFSPLNAVDIENTADAWIGLAECDPLFDEGIMYADKLRATGGNVELEIYKGVIHGFITMGRAIPEARQLHKDAAGALKRAFEK